MRAKNVLGGELASCCADPVTGFYRDGSVAPAGRSWGTCGVRADDGRVLGTYEEAGQRPVHPAPEHGFPGLKPGDRWCLCVMRWKEAWMPAKRPR